MTGRNKKAVITVIMGFALLQLLIVWVEYMQFRLNMTNPLIPSSLIEYKFKASIVFTIIKCILFIVGSVYLLAKRVFWPIVIICFLLLAFDTFLGPYFISFFVG